MKNIFLNLNTNQKIAFFTLVLGFLAIFAGNPYRGHYGKVDTKELALDIKKGTDHVLVEELADWIIKGKSEFKLIDIRSEKEYLEYHIPGAENVDLSKLVDYEILPDEKIIIYSEGGIHSAQAWFMLRSRGFKNVYMLSGGLDEWKEKILFPTIPENYSKDQASTIDKIREVSKYFGGSPQGSTNESLQIKKQLPKLELPASPNNTLGQKKKKKEGC